MSEALKHTLFVAAPVADVSEYLAAYLTTPAPLGSPTAAAEASSGLDHAQISITRHSFARISVAYPTERITVTENYTLSAHPQGTRLDIETTTNPPLSAPQRAAIAVQAARNQAEHRRWARDFAPFIAEQKRLARRGLGSA